MRKKIKDMLKMGVVFVIGFAIVQFIIVGPSTAHAYTGCNCHCQDHVVSGIAYCYGREIQCKDVCAGKVTIVEWGALTLSSAWQWYQITGF